MTDAERQSYFNAVNQMKRDVSSGQSLYDFYVSYIVPSRSPGAHFGASFGISLRTYVPTIGLRYWDSTLDSYLPNPFDSVIFSSAFFGNGNGAVTTGPFANCRTTSSLPLSRNYGQGGQLFTPAVVSTVLSERNFNQLTFCVNPFYETEYRRSVEQLRHRVLRVPTVSECTNTRECGSKYLFCDRRQGSPHCVSKVVVGGNCIGFANTDICYNSRCVNGVCLP
ncbi:unnamed protein product [Soboliphyme baturini]|uniref:EB domain-containing protein n=1 Tax=Soboliphyme baturini TaxID=241478 RepID=A0A183J3J7_9BILA|nr:unnamed protein product [Soboliphyme baturini]